MLFQDTTVLINLHAVYQDVDYWENPDQFIPERFLDVDGHLVHHERVLTFGLGWLIPLKKLNNWLTNYF